MAAGASWDASAMAALLQSALRCDVEQGSAATTDTASRAPQSHSTVQRGMS